MSKANLPAMCQQDIVVGCNLYRFHAGYHEYVIKVQTSGDGADNGVGYSGWGFVSKFLGSEREQALDEWRDLYDRRDTTYRTPTIQDTSLLDKIANQINTDFVIYQKHEMEATTLMLKLGLMVEMAKQNLKHGQLQKWIQNATDLSYRHAHRFHQLAKIFIDVQKLKSGEVFALVDPTNSESALADKLQQMAVEFLGDKSQAELLAEHGIAVKKAAKTSPGGDTSKHNKTLTIGEKQTIATEAVGDLMLRIRKVTMGDRDDRLINLVGVHTLREFLGDLIDAQANIKDLINAG